MGCGGKRCDCVIVAGENTTVEGRGSTDAPYVIDSTSAPAPVIAGCGLTGDGTAGTPLAAAPLAGQEAWPWPCDGVEFSTVKCDPDTGRLWAPPEHSTVADTLFQEHFPTGWTPLGARAFTVIDPGANTQINIPAGLLSTCRPWMYEASFTAYMDLTASADATWRAGWSITTDGATGVSRPLWGRLTAPGAVVRELHTGVAHRVGNPMVGVGVSVIAYPALEVLAGQVTVNSWTSDASVVIATR